jgi:hypothetical protein
LFVRVNTWSKHLRTSAWTHLPHLLLHLTGSYFISAPAHVILRIVAYHCRFPASS